MCNGLLEQRKTCQHCNVPFTRIGKGYPTKFCSHECRIAFNKRRLQAMNVPKPPRACEECGDVFTPLQPSHQRFCSKYCNSQWRYKNPNLAVCICQACGKQFIPKGSDRTTCCSRKCTGKLLSARAEPGKREAEAHRVANRLRELFASLKTCKVCNRAFHSKQPAQVMCSPRCKAQAVPARKCDTCDKPRTRAGRNLSKYCDECRVEAKKVSRKQQRWNRDRKTVGATAKYQSKELLLLLRGLVRRAKGQCRLCGLAMSKRCDPSSDRALEFDHKIPLCKGGPDTVKNLQAICRRCNGLKGTLTSPEIVLGGLLT
jgi:hypothetical protein